MFPKTVVYIVVVFTMFVVLLPQVMKDSTLILLFFLVAKPEAAYINKLLMLLS